MLQINPNQRLSTVAIMGHPWIAKGGAATADEVREQFAGRHQVNKTKALEDAEAKMAAKRAGGARRDFAFGGKVYLREDEIAGPETTADQIVRLRLKEFQGERGGPNQFFSVFKPDYLLTELTASMNTEGKEFTVSDATWKVNFSESKQINAEDDEEESKSDADAIFEKTNIQVEILKVAGQDKYCVDFKRKAGSAILFYSQVEKYKNAMQVCNNTTLDADESQQ